RRHRRDAQGPQGQGVPGAGGAVPRRGGGARAWRGDAMSEDIDLNLADQLEFHVNQEKKLIESNDPQIYMRDRGRTLDPSVIYFTMYWYGREIPARVNRNSQSLGKNTRGQWVSDVQWEIQNIGYEDYALQAPAKPYEFQSKNELICAVHI